jgi:hypothetical protein
MMMRVGDCVENADSVVRGIRRLSSFVGGKVHRFQDKWGVQYIVLKDEMPVASVEMGNLGDRNLLMVTLY